MTLNLISDAWIPVRRRSGAREIIAPWQMTANQDQNSIISLDASRPDFNGALIQFLIGLLQTAAPPETERDWRTWFLEPPSPERLREALKPFELFFCLGGEGPRFMQDLELSGGTELSLANLLLETPGGNTERNNSDLFIKRGQSARHCPSCLAMALYTLQTNAPAGGMGHRTSLRGGGPLSTVIMADALWRTAWVNVLPRPSFEALAGEPAKDRDSDKFPWLAPCRTSEKNTGGATTPLDAHPLQMYWAMPRRIRVDMEQAGRGACGLCGQNSSSLFGTYLTKNYGANYEGAWRHPLSPYGRDKEGMPLPRHLQPGGLVYRHWLGLVVHDKDRDIRPAAVVNYYNTNHPRRDLLESRLRRQNQPPRLWCFGYDMDNMKARGWYERTMPLVHVQEAAAVQFVADTSHLVNAAAFAVFLLRTNLKKAWYQSPGDAKGDFSFIDSRFWRETEPGFYRSVEAIARCLEEGDDAEGLRREWLNVLRVHAKDIFDDLSQGGRFDAPDPKRIALARRDLSRTMHPNSKKIAQILVLSQDQQAA